MVGRCLLLPREQAVAETRSQADGDVELDGEVASHVEHAHATRDGVHVGIFQAAQVTLIGFVQQVVADEGDGGNDIAIAQDLCAGTGSEQGIAGSCGLAVALDEVMALLEVTIDIYCDKCVGQRVPVAHEVIAQFTLPPGWRCARQVLALS